MPKAQERRIKTLREIIRESGISRETLNAAIASGELKAFRIGKKSNSPIRVTAEEFARFLERQAIRPDAR